MDTEDGVAVSRCHQEATEAVGFEQVLVERRRAIPVALRSKLLQHLAVRQGDQHVVAPAA
jgi:hypothetical protein